MQRATLTTEQAIEALQELLPGFHRGATLDFTELFLRHGSNKRRRLGQYRAQFATASSEVVSAHRPSSMQVLKGRGSSASSRQTNTVPPIHRIEAALKDPGLLVDDWQAQLSRPFLAQGHRAGPAETEEAWERQVRWHSDAAPTRHPQLLLDFNDAEMILEAASSGSAAKVSEAEQHVPSTRAARAAAALNPLNLSNDRFYELPREHRQKVRQTLGQIVVQHARPALKLQLPWVRVA